MAKLFTPSVRCPICRHANDVDFRYCQQCGYKRQLIVSTQSNPLDAGELYQIDERLRQLTLYTQATSYSKQKDSLQRELKTFLSTLPGAPSLANVTPRDLCRFLVFKIVMVKHKSIRLVVLSWEKTDAITVVAR